MRAIEVRNLVKRYGNHKALADVSFDVDKGEIFGLLGPNGAGKSTTVNILTCQLMPTSGDALVAGLDPVSDAKRLKGNIGVVPQDLMLNEYLTARQNLAFYGKLHGLPVKALNSRIRRLLERVELADRGDELVKNYSKGMKQRLNLVLALVHEPEVIFLDEPTTGLDPKGRREIWELIEELKTEGRTILITTHYMEEAEHLCDRIAIIDSGEIIALGTPRELKAMLRLDKTVEVDIEYYDGLLDDVKRFNRVKRAFYNGNLKLICEDAEGLIPELVAFFRSRGLRNINLREPTLEDVFINLTGKSLKG